MEFKKNTLLAIVLSVCGIFISTLSFIFIIVADKMNGSGTGSFSLSLVTLLSPLPYSLLKMCLGIQ